MNRRAAHILATWLLAFAGLTSFATQPVPCLAPLAVLSQTFDAELTRTEPFRGGIKRRAVWLDGASPEQHAQAQRLLARYGVEVLKAPKNPDADLLLALEKRDVTTLAVLKVQSHAGGAVNLVARSRPSGQPVEQGYSHEPSLAAHSPRVTPFEMALSKYVVEQLYYSTPRNFNEAPPVIENVVDLNFDTAEFLHGPTGLGKALQHAAVENMVHTVLNDGVYLRAPVNRRQAHIYVSGSHSGVPLTPQAKHESELAYLVHDLTHELVPDPLIDAGSGAEGPRKAYLAHRAVSEAVAMAIADIWFQKLNAVNGLPSSTSSQLHRYLPPGLLADRSADLKKLIHANVDLLIKGDDRLFRELLDGTPASLTALQKYRDEFTPLIVADMDWNNRNVKGAEAEPFQRWTDSVLPLFAAHGMPRESLSAVTKRLGVTDGTPWPQVVDKVFEDIYETRLRPAVERDRTPLLTADRRRARGVTRLMAGQMGAFARFADVAETPHYQKAISEFLLSKMNGMTKEDARHVRGLYDEYLTKLLEQNIIHHDDYQTYRGLYPPFEPYYLRFDQYGGLTPQAIVDGVR